MRRGGRITVAVAAVAVLWAGFAYQTSRQPDYGDYHRTMVQAAQSAHDAVRTGWLVSEQELAGRVFPPYTKSTFDDATRALAGAQKKVAGAAPPDDRSRALRDDLAPLLARATVLLGDAAGATDDAALRRSLGDLDALAGRLDDFLTAHG